MGSWNYLLINQLADRISLNESSGQVGSLNKQNIFLLGDFLMASTPNVDLINRHADFLCVRIHRCSSYVLPLLYFGNVINPNTDPAVFISVTPRLCLFPLCVVVRLRCLTAWLFTGNVKWRSAAPRRAALYILSTDIPEELA